ncbi:hypothetical protein C8J56DRAFT_969830, partial [Mycena floridula]
MPTIHSPPITVKEKKVEAQPREANGRYSRRNVEPSASRQQLATSISDLQRHVQSPWSGHESVAASPPGSRAMSIAAILSPRPTIIPSRSNNPFGSPPPAPKTPARPRTIPNQPRFQLASPVAINPSPVNPSARDDPAELDKRSPSIKAVTLSPASWPKDCKDLSLRQLNFTTWERHLSNVLGGHGTLYFHIYEADQWLCPDPADAPMSCLNWHLNDQAVLSFMRGKLAPEEFKTADKEDTAIGLYRALRTRHQNRGAVAQVRILDEALSIKFGSPSTFGDTTLRLTNLNRDLWENGPIDPDTFLSVLLLRATLANHPALFRDLNDHLVSATTANPYTSDHVAERIAAEAITPTHAKSPDTVNVAAVVPAAPKVAPRGRGCNNCISKGLPGGFHTEDYCIKPGGKMEGKTLEESKEKRLADKKAKEAKSTSTAHVAEEGHVGLDTSPLESIFDSRVESIMTEVDKSEYEILIAINSERDMTPRVDWRVEQKPISEIAYDATIPETIDSKSPTALNDAPFLMDSCASIHISNDRSDFKTLHPLSVP